MGKIYDRFKEEAKMIAACNLPDGAMAQGLLSVIHKAAVYRTLCGQPRGEPTQGPTDSMFANAAAEKESGPYPLIGGGIRPSARSGATGETIYFRQSVLVFEQPSETLER